MKKIILLSSIIFLGAGCFQAPVEDVVETQNDVVKNQEVDLQVDVENLGGTAITLTITDGSMSVLDYYYAIPEKYLSFDRQEREESIRVQDLENYYIQFNPLSLDGTGSMAVFIVEDDRELVFLEIKGCGPLCMQDIYVLELIDDVWVDQTSKLFIFPEPPEAIRANIKTVYINDNPTTNPNDIPFVPLLEIPQHGTELRVYDQFTGYVYAKVKWNGQIFVSTFLNSVVESIDD